MNSPGFFRALLRRGFTLVEVLVVIAIIGILSALLLPALGGMQKSAAGAKEISNLRQIGNGAMLFAAENDGFLPNSNSPIPGTKDSPDGGDRWTFQESVDRYLSTRWTNNPGSIYNYRGNPIWTSVYASAYPGWSPYVAVGQKRPFAYGYNNYLHNPNWGGKISRIPSPSKIVMMGEVNDESSISPTATPVTAENVKTTYRMNRKGAANYLFCDGHVETLVGNQNEAALTAAGKTSIWKWW